MKKKLTLLNVHFVIMKLLSLVLHRFMIVHFVIINSKLNEYVIIGNGMNKEHAIQRLRKENVGLPTSEADAEVVSGENAVTVYRDALHAFCSEFERDIIDSWRVKRDHDS